jgi:hypothetical protein
MAAIIDTHTHHSEGLRYFGSVFRFPPELRPYHIAELQKRAISPLFAIASGVRYAADNELRDLGFAAGLPTWERKKGLQGLAFAYFHPTTRAVRLYRIKPDKLFVIAGKPAKYLSRIGDPVFVYFPHTTTAEMLSNPPSATGS